MKNFYLPFIFLFNILFFSCKGPEPLPPYTYESNPHYYLGYADFYGAYYAQFGNLNNTISLSLFSDSLKINENGELLGFGQYLFLEDIFVAPTDTVLSVGTYRITNKELTEPFTIYAGKNDTIDSEVYPIGVYISYFEQNSAKSTYKLITQGSFTYSIYNGKAKIVCNFKTADDKELKGSFTGDLPFFIRSLTPKKSVSRNVFRYKL